MKKLLLVLGMVTCMAAALAGCSSKTAQKLDLPSGMTQDQLVAYADQLVDGMRTVVDSGMKEQYANDAVIFAALESWEAAAPEMGDYIATQDHEIAQHGDLVTVNVKVQGSLRPAVIEVVLNQEFTVASISTNVTYTLGELMVKAALNTVLGMGTVYIVLILISLIISLFGYIPKLQESIARKQKAAQPVEKEAAADNTIAQIVEKEELSDDLELAAVIAAAVAAYEGTVSPDAYIVRSIRRAR